MRSQEIINGLIKLVTLLQWEIGESHLWIHMGYGMVELSCPFKNMSVSRGNCWNDPGLGLWKIHPDLQLLSGLLPGAANHCICTPTKNLIIWGTVADSAGEAKEKPPGKKPQSGYAPWFHPTCHDLASAGGVNTMTSWWILRVFDARYTRCSCFHWFLLNELLWLDVRVEVVEDWPKFLCSPNFFFLIRYLESRFSLNTVFSIYWFTIRYFHTLNLSCSNWKAPDKGHRPLRWKRHRHRPRGAASAAPSLQAVPFRVNIK